MQVIIGSLVAWVAKQFLPSSWIKQKLTTVITLLLTRLFELADKLAQKTTITDVDDKAVTSLRSYVMAEGVIQHFVDYVWAMIFGGTPPTPVDPINPPEPTPEPNRPGVIGRISGWLKQRFANNW